MTPAFSQKAMGLMAPYFSLSVRGFGLDLLFAKLAEENGLKVAVVDSIKASHNSVIGQNAGAYYELWSLIDSFGLDSEFYLAN